MPDERCSGIFERHAPLPRDSSIDVLSPLLVRTRHGDQLAACDLVDRLTPPLRRYLRRTLPVHEDVEDALQESLLAVLEALPGFRGEASLIHFAIQVARRLALSRRRSRRRQDDRSSLFARLELPLVAPPSEPHELSLEERRHAELSRLLGEIPVAHARTFALAIVGEHSLTEVAEATGVPVNTVRSRLRRARRWLRSRIEADAALTELLGKRQPSHPPRGIDER